MYNLTDALAGFLEKSCDRCPTIGYKEFVIQRRCRECWKIYYENGEDKK